MLKGANMTIAKQSPTVLFSEKKNPDWFEQNGGDYGYGNDPNSAYDNDGYDKAGYDKYGIDRAGVHENQYTPELYQETLEDFKDIYIPELSIKLQSSEYQFLDEQERELLTEKRRIEKLLKEINKDLENVARKKADFGVSTVISENVVSPKRGFGR